MTGKHAPQHPEGLTSNVESLRKGARLIHPPLPDADGKFDFCEVLDWSAFMAQVCDTLTAVCKFLRGVIDVMPAESALRARECLCKMESIRPLFLSRRLDLIPEQERCKDIYAMLFAEIMVWAGFEDSLRMMARGITGSSNKWRALSSALVENRLAGQKDWRSAKSPAKWVKQATNNIALKDSYIKDFALDYSREPETIALEEMAETPLEALLERKYSSHSIRELETAAAGDEELAEYVKCKIRYPQLSCQAIWLHLGWDTTRGKRVDRRHRRLRRRLQDLGAGMQCRDYRPPAGISDANFTTYFEELFDGRRGRATGVWQHRNTHP